jgi:hypothetical protein
MKCNLRAWVDSYAYKVVVAIVILSIGMIIFGLTMVKNIVPTTSDNTPFVSSTSNTTPLDMTEQQYLLAIRTRGKLARDIFIALEEKWPLTLFLAIRRSEQISFDQIGSLLSHYGLSDPVAGLAPGKFRTHDRSKFYLDQVARGSMSRADALKAGGFLEEIKIQNLDQSIQVSHQTNVTSIYQQLKRGARNNLRSFAQALEFFGETYHGQFLSELEVSSIITSPMEAGPP